VSNFRGRLREERLEELDVMLDGAVPAGSLPGQHNDLTLPQ
jgi:hypothetical protein